MRLLLSLLALAAAPLHAAAPAPKLPLILVKGFGPKIASMRTYRDFLQNDGYSRRDLNLLEYPQTASPEALRAAARKSLREIFRRYPANQKFDLITHSFGAFVGPYAAFPEMAEGRIRKWVALAGMTQGQDAIPLCNGIGKAFCGDTLPLLTPFRSPLVMDFLKDADEGLRAIEKCALFAPDDGRINDPPDSAVLPGAVAVEVSGATHNDFIWNEDAYRIMRHTCFGDPLPKRKLKFAWRYR